MTTIFLHDINPVLVDFGIIKLTYYGMAYAIGILLGLYYLKKLNKLKPLTTEKNLDEIILYAVFGVIIGGRLGYVIFYNPVEYLKNPIDILKTWEGGMSFHGGFLGFLYAMYLYAKKYKVHFWNMMDFIALCAPIGLFFGRIANFINGELYGKPTSGDWGVIFPFAGELPRHPSQLYQAMLEGIVLFFCLNLLFYKTKIYDKPKSLSGLFLILYGFFRIVAEAFRQPDAHIGYIGFLTMGQILSLPMIFAGSILLSKNLKKNASR